MIEMTYITVGGATQSGATIIVNHFLFVVSHRQIQSSYSDKDIFQNLSKLSLEEWADTAEMQICAETSILHNMSPLSTGMGAGLPICM